MTLSENELRLPAFLAHVQPNVPRSQKVLAIQVLCPWAHLLLQKDSIFLGCGL